jgi:aspartate-semialdehyde dehydrogenase
MKTLAIVEPGGLTARELRDQLARRPELWREARLLTTNEDEVGTLTDLAGSAAVVQLLTPESLEGVDLVFLAGAAATSRATLPALPPGTRVVWLSPDATLADGPPLVAGVNLPASLPGPVAVSPRPGAILLAHLLHPLLDMGLRRAEVTLLQPVSVFAPDALDQLYEQARGLLTFQPRSETRHWDGQLAFNLVPAGTGDELREQVEAMLGGGFELTAQVLLAGVFHSYAASLHLAFDADPGLEALRDALGDQPWVSWAEQESLGPVDAAGAEEVLLGQLRADRGRPGSYWLWAVMDNLTRGGASNAVALAEALLAG